MLIGMTNNICSSIKEKIINDQKVAKIIKYGNRENLIENIDDLDCPREELTNNVFVGKSASEIFDKENIKIAITFKGTRNIIENKKNSRFLYNYFFDVTLVEYTANMVTANGIRIYALCDMIQSLLDDCHIEGIGALKLVEAEQVQDIDMDYDSYVLRFGVTGIGGSYV